MKTIRLMKILVAAMLLAFTSAASAGAGTSVTTYKFGGDKNFPPFEYLDANGSPAGFNIELIKKIAEIMHFKTDIVLDDWNKVKSALNSNKINAILGMYYTEERSRQFLFSKPYYYMQITIFVREGDDKITSINDLRNKEIITQDGHYIHETLLKRETTDRLIAVPSSKEAFLLLASGKGDCVVLEKEQGNYLINKLGLKKIKEADIPIISLNYCLAIGKSDSLLALMITKGIDSLRKSGEYDKLKTKFLAEIEYAPSASFGEYAKYFILIVTSLLVLLAFAIYWNKSLNSRVQARTLELDAELQERLKVEERISQSEQLFRSVWENSNDGMRLVDEEGRVVAVNEAYCQLLGMHKEDLLDKDFTLPYEMPDLPEMRTKVHDKMVNGQIERVKIKFVTLKNKKKLWLEFRNSYVTSIEGKPLVLSIVRDITDQIEYEKTINYANRLYAFLSHVNQTIVKVKEKETFLKRIGEVAVDQGFFNLVMLLSYDHAKNELSLESMAGKDKIKEGSFPLKVDFKHKEDCPIVKAIFESDYACSNDPSGCPLGEVGLCGQMLRQRNYSIGAFAYKIGGQVAGLMVFCTHERDFFNESEIKLLREVADDVSFALETINKEQLRRQIESDYEGLFENSHDPIIISDPASKTVLNVNNSACLEYGYSREEFIGLPLKKIMFEYDKGLRRIAMLLADGSAQNFDTVHIHRDGKKMYYNINAVKVQFKGLDAILAVHRDITERIKAEEALQKAKEEAEKSNKLKSEFLAQMSHEIRTPINVILSFASLIKYDLEEHLTDDIREAFNTIQSGGRRLIRTIDLILNMSELQTGSYEPNFALIDIDAEILSGLTTEFLLPANTKKLKLKYIRMATNTKAIVDHYTVTQIFSNLIENAIKFTNKGEIEVNLYNDAEGRVCVSVRDSGVGISKDYLSLLFTPFSQEEMGYTRKFEGNGLGLALVKKYCELNSADIQVQSEKGHGSVFTTIFCDKLS